MRLYRSKADEGHRLRAENDLLRQGHAGADPDPDNDTDTTLVDVDMGGHLEDILEEPQEGGPDPSNAPDMGTRAYADAEVQHTRGATPLSRMPTCVSVYGSWVLCFAI